MEIGKTEPDPVNAAEEMGSLPKKAKSGVAGSWTFNAKSASIIIIVSALVCVAVLWFVLKNTPPDHVGTGDGGQVPTPQDAPSPLQLLNIVTEHFHFPLERASQMNRTAAAQVVAGNPKEGLETLGKSLGIVIETSPLPATPVDSSNPHPRFEEKVYLLNEIAVIQFEAGSSQEARSTLQRVTTQLRAHELIGWHLPRSHVAAALTSAGRSEEAMGMALGIDSTLPRVKILMEIASTQVDLGEPFQAHATLQSALMEIGKLAPEHSPNAFRARIAILFSDADHAGQAKDILTSLPHDDHFPEAIFHLCSAHARARRVMDAKRETEAIKSPYWRSMAHLELATYGQPEISTADVFSLVKKAEDEANELPVPKQEAILRGKIARCWLAFGSETRARQSLERGFEAALEVGGENERAEIFTSFASLYVRLGDLEPALEIARKQVASALRARALKDLALTMHECGSEGAAITTLQESFQNTKTITDPEAHKAIIATIVQLQCQWGVFEKAVDCLDGMDAGSSKTRGCFEIAFWLATTDPPATETPGRRAVISPRSLKMSFTSEEDLRVAQLLELLQVK